MTDSAPAAAETVPTEQAAAPAQLATAFDVAGDRAALQVSAAAIFEDQKANAPFLEVEIRVLMQNPETQADVAVTKITALDAFEIREVEQMFGAKSMKPLTTCCRAVLKNGDMRQVQMHPYVFLQLIRLARTFTLNRR